MRRWASQKKSPASMTSAARLNASLCSRIAPSTERSASRLCGSVRSATALSAMSGLLLRPFRGHLHLHGRHHVAMKLHGHSEVAELLDWLRQLHFPSIDVEAFRQEGFGDVCRRDRPVQRLGFTDQARDRDLDHFQPLANSVRNLLFFGFFGLELRAL